MLFSGSVLLRTIHNGIFAMPCAADSEKRTSRNLTNPFVMKKSLLILAVVAFGFASCKKDRTCECCLDSLCVSETQNRTKKDASDWCDKAESDAAASGVTGWSCKLK